MDEQTSPYAIAPEPDYASRLEHVLIARLDAEPTQREEPDVMVDVATFRTGARRSRRQLVIVSIAACLAALAVAGIVINRSVDRSQQNATPPPIAVSFDLAWPDLQGLEQPKCVTTAEPFYSASEQRCFRTFYGLATLTGDLDGRALWTMVGNVGKSATPDDATVETPAAFNGTYIVQATIPGCGTGEFMIAEQLRFDGWENGAFSGTWQIIPGSARGDLANLSGGGVVPGDQPDQNTTQATRTGSITCPPSPASP